MRRETIKESMKACLAILLFILLLIGSFAFFYHGLDHMLRLGLTSTFIISGEEGRANFTAVSDLPIYISGEHTFDEVGEVVDFTVILYDDRGVYLTNKSVYLDSPGMYVETLSYHRTLDYTVTPGEQYSIEVVGQNFEGVIEQPHTILAEFFLHWYYAGIIVGIIFIIISLIWVCFGGILGLFAIEEVKKRRTKDASMGV